jgi:hypothetical protein
MNQILDFVSQSLDYINWVIQFHLAEYFYIALGFIFVALILLIFLRSKVIYIFPMIFAIISLVLVLMILTNASDFEWDYTLLLAFVNFAVGYALFVFISMVLSKPQI